MNDNPDLREIFKDSGIDLSEHVSAAIQKIFDQNEINTPYDWALFITFISTLSLTICVDLYSHLRLCHNNPVALKITQEGQKEVATALHKILSDFEEFKTKEENENN